MKRVFADTSYWIAYLYENDQWSEVANKAFAKIGNAEIVTTETVLIELLNYFSEYSSRTKEFIALSVESKMSDENNLIL